MRRRCVRRTVLGLGFALVALRAAASHAQDAAPVAPAPGAPAKPPPPPTPEQAADAVLAAVAVKDDGALKALAAKDDPDPWLVADELIRRGQHDVADAFAKAAPRVDTEKLSAYVASRRGGPDDASRRARLAAANVALAAGKPEAALAALGAEEPAPIADVVGVRLAMGRGIALASLVRLGASAAAFLTAGEAAEQFGWLARASGAFHESGSSAYRGSAFAAARGAWERRLSISERRGDRAGAAATLGNIGVVYAALGDYAKALSTYERALTAKESLGDQAGAAGTLVNIGSVYERLGDFATALSIHERALAAMEALGDKAGVATTLGNIGIVYYSLGDYAKALSIHEHALAAMEALGDKAGVATTLGNIGIVHRALGDYAKALAMYERALAAKEALGNKHGTALMLGNIGAVHHALGEYAEALSTFERALVAMEALGNRAGAATTLGNLGNVHRALGDYAKALAMHERALAATEALGNQAGAALTLVNIGNVHAALGDYAKAIPFLDRAGRAAEKLGATGLQVVALRGLAWARLASGDARRAIESAREAVSLLKTLVGGLGEGQGATARAQYGSLFSTGLRAAAKANDAREAAFFVESGRAGTLLESLGSRESLRAALVPEELRVAEVLARAHEARALVAYTKALDAGDLATIRARRDELEATRAGIVEVVERTQRDAKRAAQVVYPVAARLDEIQGFLAAGDALVLYGLAEQDVPAHALVLTRGEARIVALGASSEIVSACEALAANDASVDPTTAFERLRTLLIEPLGLSKGTKRLLVSPEGPLSYLPFAALAPDLVVAYQASGSTYGVLREQGTEQGQQVLALADADYTAKYEPTALGLYAPNALALAGPTRGAGLALLPGTRAEAMAVGDVRLFAKDASEAGLRVALASKGGRWRAVHFACHGLVDPDRPTLSSLALTPDAGNDGFLTALEVLRMRIPADLVVLSACETGKGKIVGGEGIVGLTRAFMYAGSPRVICSLWKVDDDATRALMTKFYELWNPRAQPEDPERAKRAEGAPGSGLPTAEALRQAQAFVKSQEKWKHPYYWAAWVLWGLPG